MKTVLYISEALHKFTAQELKELSFSTTLKNKSKEISGYLYYKDKHFLQYVEGDEQYINELINTIKTDPKHRFIMAIEENSLDDRRFPDWGMKSIAKVMFNNSVVETTIIKTMTLFKENNLTLSASSKSQLFRLMDELSVSVQA
jgi:dolichyl-phosphate-mannose--protein O-mannosyl transferase